MFAKLRGLVDEKKVDNVIIDVGGLGYEVQISLNTHNALPENGEEATLYIHTHVREDAFRLIGFSELDEKELFLLLVQISGIGPRMALAILSNITPPEFVDTLKRNNLARLVSIPGIGKRKAERIIVELRDKIIDMNLGQDPQQAQLNDKLNETLRDLHSALTNMGYKAAQVDKVVGLLKPEAEAGKNLGALVREGLKKLLQGK